jgi:putative addiction module component (TIGR02574 family)
MPNDVTQWWNPDMTISRDELYREALLLDESERAALAGLLLESLDAGSDEGVEAAWLVEIERRMADLDAGTVETIPWEVVKSRLRQRSGG